MRQAEALLDQMRDLLTLAREAERGRDHERAAAFGARARNKLELAVKLQRRVVPLR